MEFDPKLHSKAFKTKKLIVAKYFFEKESFDNKAWALIGKLVLRFISLYRTLVSVAYSTGA